MGERDDEKSARGFPPHDEVEFYRVYRERVTAQDTLLSQRLSWLITVQTIMFSFTAIAFFRGGRGEIDKHGTVLMCFLGSLLCLVGGIGVWAASHRIDEVKKEYLEKHPTGRPHPALPSLVASSWTHSIGKLMPLLIPPLFLAAWVMILAVAMK